MNRFPGCATCGDSLDPQNANTVAGGYDNGTPVWYCHEECDPRLRCRECAEVIESAEDEAVWVDPESGEATTGDRGAPFHVECAPEQAPA